MTNLLVAYASKHGATAEIASAIAEQLQLSADIHVDLRPVEEVKTLSPYDAVVVGSAVYMGQWQPAATAFLKQFEPELSRRHVWLFSSGPTGRGEPSTLLKGWEFPEALQAIMMRIKPHGVALFHGRLDPDSLNFLENSAIRLVRAETGDFRDWTSIREWADGIGYALHEIGGSSERTSAPQMDKLLR